VREISALPPAEVTSGKLLRDELTAKYLNQLPDLGLLDQFGNAPLLKENLFKALSEIHKNLGKKPFR
jgi:predicted transcriptional regulator